ncbi:MAG: SusE domain-containing protein, partial [Sphingobacteriaceae bacterium]|nr:SusE domain-containing protein [Sphingobacteriaceae bacterium]
MKTIVKKLLVLTLASITLLSCKKDETLTKVGATPSGATLSASATTIVLSKPNIANTAVNFTLTKPDFGYQAAVSNTLQLSTSANFSAPKEFSLNAGVLAKSFTVLDLNALLLSMNLPTGVASNVNVRVKSTIANSQNPAYSNAVVVTVTPFALIEQLIMPGAYQGWNPATADSLTSATGNGIYIGTIQFDASGSMFKLMKGKSWAIPAYGVGAGGAGTIALGGGDITGPTTSAPYTRDNFQVTVDLNSNTIAYELNSWGIIGSATAGGWSDDTVMKFNNT